MVMAKFTVDGPNRLLIAKAGVTSVDVQVDLYSDSKEHWLTTDDVKYPPPFRTIAGDPISGTKNFSAGYFLTSGWKIRPDEADHDLLFDGNLFLDDGETPGILVPTVGAFTVLANIERSADARTITGFATDLWATPVAGATPGTMGWAALLRLYDDGSGPGVHLDVDNGVDGAGVLGVNGIPDAPVKTETVARALADALGIRTYVMTDSFPSLVIQNDHLAWLFRSRHGFIGGGVIDVNGKDLSGSEFVGVHLEGDCSNIGNVFANSASVDEVTGFSGNVRKSRFGNIGVNLFLNMRDCDPYPLLPNPATITAAAGTLWMSLVRQSGNVKIASVTNASTEVEISLSQGSVELLPSCTSGAFTISGVGKLIDGSTGTATVDSTRLVGELVRDTTVLGATAGTRGWSDILALYRSQHGLAVYWSNGNGTAGQVPGVNGTYLSPCNTEADAKAVADALGIRAYIMGESSPFSTVLTLDHPGWSFHGQSEQGEVIPRIDPNGVDIDNSHFSHISIGGDLGNGWVNARTCFLQTLTNAYGRFEDCTIYGATLVASANVNLINCTAANIGGVTITGTDPAPLFLPVGWLLIHMEDCDGEWAIGGSTNTGTQVEALGGTGAIRLLATNTQGNFRIEGDQRVIDETTPAAGLVITVENQANEQLSAVHGAGQWDASGMLTASLSVPTPTPGTVGWAQLLALYEDGRGPAFHFNGSTGTDGSVPGEHGTSAVPCKTEANIIALAAQMPGIKAVSMVSGTLTLTQAYRDWMFRGGNSGYWAYLNVNGQDIWRSKVYDIYVYGDMGGAYTWIQNAIVGVVTNFGGDIWDSQVYDIQLGDNTYLGLWKCRAQAGVVDPVTITSLNDNAYVVCDQFSGHIQFDGLTNPTESFDIGMAAGTVEILATCTQGVFTAYGNAKGIDRTTPQAGLSVDFSGLDGNHGKTADLMGITGKVVEHKRPVGAVLGHQQVDPDGAVEQDISVKEIDADTVRLNEP